MDWVVFFAAVSTVMLCLSACCVLSAQVVGGKNPIAIRSGYAIAFAALVGVIYGCLYGALECLENIIN